MTKRKIKAPTATKRLLALSPGLFLIASLSQSFGQTNPNFNGATVTPEGAIHISWNSTSNHTYEIEEADALDTNADGTTAWNLLFSDYPSQGTNTFWLDTGNYNLVPPILHPKYMPMRFYRIVDLGPDSTSDEPSVSISSPTTGTVASGTLTVTVSAYTDQPVLSGTELYVDGQEMDVADSTTNYSVGSTNYEVDTYTVNSCEWLNGPHTLFATATARSGMSGPSGNYPIYTGNAVSPFVPVSFTNLISEIAFSQWFFEPSLGQTQVVTASFAANCDWTLQIEDVNSNVVRTATGSGDSMTFDWDGTGNGEASIPDGVYTYLVSAQTNGGSSDVVAGGSGGGGSPPTLAMARLSSASAASTELLAAPADGSGPAVPFALYPPGMDTNNLAIFEGSPADFLPQTVSIARPQPFGTMDSGGGGASPDYSGSSSQNGRAPTRPPTAPVKNPAGTYGIGYYSWPNPQTVNIPNNGVPPPLTQVCHLDGNNSNAVYFENIPECQEMASEMESTMKKNGWQLAFENGDQSLPVKSIRRTDQGYAGGAIFTTATIGLFVDHGDYGTDPDYSAGSSGSKQAYFRSDADAGDNGWLRMCQFGFGGNLKWMGILACNSLNTYSSMANAGAIPLNTTHLVCGASTIVAVGDNFGMYWAQNMIGNNQPIADAWFNAGISQYHGQTYPYNNIVFRVAGYPECLDDTVQSNTAPISPSSAPGNLQKLDLQVWP